MGRQRTVDDANFWRAPHVAYLTQEDKATLLYLLTSPSSNVIGVYPIVPRVSAAEMGWTADQLLPVICRLHDAELVWFDASTSFVWVRVWWEHNSPQMALGTKLRVRTFAQIDAIPTAWRLPFVRDLQARVTSEPRSALDRWLSTGSVLMEDRQSADRLSDTLSENIGVNVNNNSIYKNNSNLGAAGAERHCHPGRDQSDVAIIELQKLRKITSEK